MSLLTDNRRPEWCKSSRRPAGVWRELACRHSAGITVGLYWRPDGDEISVRVSDELSGESFVLEPPKTAALRAFYHPYAFQRRERTDLIDSWHSRKGNAG